MHIKRKDLPNKPLLEAIFELHLTAGEDPGEDTLYADRIDASYPLWVGNFYDKIKAEYPAHETLSPYGFPGMEGVLCNRFRSAPGKWPLIQIGPKVVTLNQTSSYHWENSFLPSISKLSEAILLSHPCSGLLQVDRLVLRYINGFDFSSVDQSDAIESLSRHFDLGISINENLISKLNLSPVPAAVDISIDYPHSNPAGNLKVRFSNPNKDSPSLIVWEIVFSSGFEGEPFKPASVEDWAVNAHELTSGAFFSLLDSDLYQSFQ